MASKSSFTPNIKTLSHESKVIPSVFSQLQFPRKSVFKRLSFKEVVQNSNSYSKVMNSQRASFHFGATSPTNEQPDSVATAAIYSAFSPNRPKVDQVKKGKCWHCKELGHTVKTCASYKDLQRFMSLARKNPSTIFSSYNPSPSWPNKVDLV
jgi:hypothetical protein